MNKKLIIIILVVISISSILFLLKDNNKDDKIKLERNYYNTGGLVKKNAKDINKLINSKKSFILFTYNSYCSFKVSCDGIFYNVSKKANISILQIPFEEFKNTKLYEKIKYAPSVIIINKGKIVAYLDANKDSDLDKYQDEKAFEKWLYKYIKK